MSTKTTFKRIALVAVAALGLGVLSVAPSNATSDPTNHTLAFTAGGTSASASGSFTQTALLIRYLNSWVESLGRLISALKLPSFFLDMMMDCFQSLFKPSISTVSASAGLKLNFMWRKYVAYKSLKGQLSRVDRPYTIILHGLRDLPKKY